MSENEQEISTEDVDKRLEPVMKKKRIMTDLQKENLVKARARALELRKALREKEGPSNKKPKPLTKLEQRLLQTEETSSAALIEPPPKPEAPPKPEPAPEAPKTKKWVLEPDANGNLHFVEK